ncbi:MAG: CRISPR-associated protein Cst1 [Candidatus Atribacteria bacterium]|nr:CRISPR-associated protein Cst1 [Candidatus Atribacteria bacterium]
MNEIVLYPGNWLYNAGVVGLLRILDFGHKQYEFVSGNVRIKSDVLQDFALIYFAYATKLALLETFNFLRYIGYERNKVTKKLGETQGMKIAGEIKEIENEFKRMIFVLDAPTDWQNFIERIGEIIKKSQDSIESLLKQTNVLENSIGIKIEKLSDFIDGVNGMKFVADYLGRFYFNKRVVANPKGKDPTRIVKFTKQYLSFLDDDFSLKKGYSCPICGQMYHDWKFFSELNEGDFSPLGVSRDKFSNVYTFFASGGISYPIKCPLCQLVFLCAFAGFNRKPWFVKEIDETDYIFVDYLDLKSSYQVNNQLNTVFQEANLQILMNKEQLLNPYVHVLEIILETVEKKMRWAFDNILFVEFKISPRKDTDKPHFIYFGLDRALSETFVEFSEFGRFLSSLAFPYEVNKNVFVWLSTEVLKRLIEKRPIVTLAMKYLAEKLSNQDARLLPLWSMIVLDFIVRGKRNYFKNSSGVNKLNSREIYGILRGVKHCGANSFSVKEIESKKRFHIAQRFLSLIRGARKEDFCNELIRLYIVYEKPIPKEVVSFLYESEVVSFQEKALAFIAGFLNPEGENESQEKNLIGEEI